VSRPERKKPRGDMSREGRRNGTTAAEVRKAQTKNEILEMRIAGLSVRAIAKSLGRKGHGYVHTLLVAAISEVPEENATHAKRLELERLDALWRAAYPLAVGLPELVPEMDATGAPTGRMVQGPRRPVDIEAQRQCIRITAQRAKLRGLYHAPVEKHLHAFAGSDDFEKWSEDDMRAFAETGKLPKQHEDE